LSANGSDQPFNWQSQSKYLRKATSSSPAMMEASIFAPTCAMHMLQKGDNRTVGWHTFGDKIIQTNCIIKGVKDEKMPK
jgi:hypothetical protein